MPTVQELYERHMANLGDECISIFGYPGYQVLEAVQFWEKSKVHVAGTQWTAKEMEILKNRQKELNDMAGLMVNRKYEWATPEAKSDKQFLMWLWSRLHRVFGESENIGYMQRLDAIISSMPGNGRIDITDEGKFDIYRKGKLVHSDD